jgi:hypothetical protein
VIFRLLFLLRFKASQLANPLKLEPKVLLLLILLTGYFSNSQTCTANAALYSPACGGTICNGVISVSITGFCNTDPYIVSLIGGCSTSPSYTVVATPTVVFFNNICGCFSGYNVVVTDYLSNLVNILQVNVAAVQLLLSSSTSSPSCNNSCTGAFSVGFFGFSPYTVTVSPSVAPVSTTTSQYALNGLCPGIYTLNVSDNYGCPATFTRAVNALVTPTITALGGTICSGKSYTITPTGAVSYTYITGISIVSPTTTSTYSVIGTNSIGCSSNTAIVTISVNPTPTVFANGNAVCSNQTLSLTATATLANAYNWTGPNGFSSNQQNPLIINPLVNTSGIYSVLVTSTAGCTNTALCNVTVTALPTVSLSSNSPVCLGSSLILVANASTGSYLWQGPNNFTTNSASATIANYQAAAIYTLFVSSGPCIANSTIPVSVNPLPVITTITSNSAICLGETAQLNAMGANTYTWNTGISGTSLAITPTITTTYSVSGTDLNGCTNTAIITQSVDTCLSLKNEELNKNILIYPNPNNGEFILQTTQSAKIKIYNSLGQLIMSKEIYEGENNIDISPFTKGIYFVEVRQGDKIEQLKIIKD